MILLTVVIICLQLALAIFIFYLIIAFVTGAPFVPTTNPAAAAMIELANIKPGMTIYDLGSGDGKLLFLAADQGAKAIGLEINPWLALITNIKAHLLRKPLIRAYWKNFWSAKLTDADVVFVYLLPWRMQVLANKLKSQLRPGTIIVSNSFIFPDWPIIRSDKKLHVYVFRV